MKDPKDPVQQLTDTLTLLRVEIADVKSRQITEKQLKHLHAALEKTTVQVATVAQSAGEGAQLGVRRLSHEMGRPHEICKRPLSAPHRASQTPSGSFGTTSFPKNASFTYFCSSQHFLG